MKKLCRCENGQNRSYIVFYYYRLFLILTVSGKPSTHRHKKSPEGQDNGYENLFILQEQSKTLAKNSSMEATHQWRIYLYWAKFLTEIPYNDKDAGHFL